MVPFGVLNMTTGALMLLFGKAESSDFWGDSLKIWWERVRSQFPSVRRLHIYLDNGPKNSGRRTQFLKRLVQFSNWSGLEVRLIYYPPYHSKYNPIERCWSSLQQKWNGVLLTCWAVVQACAMRMTWKQKHPAVVLLDGEYPIGVTVSKQEMVYVNKGLQRSTTLPDYDVLITPQTLDGR